MAEDKKPVIKRTLAQKYEKKTATEAAVLNQ